MNATRTDVHRPSAPDFDPAGYELVDVFDLHPKDGDWDGSVATRLQDGGINWAEHLPVGYDVCGHCGTHLRYAALMRHDATRTMMFIGQTCLGERFWLATAADFKALRESAAAKAEETRRRNREHELKSEVVAFINGGHPLLVELSYRNNGGTVDHNTFLSDVAYKLFQYGNLSTNQESAVVRVIQQDIERAGKRAAELIEHPATNAPTGRVTVTGEVLMVKFYDSDYGGSLKMIVRDDTGFRVFVTVPSSIDANKGSRVTFTATITPADDDPTFSFGKRPSKASVL